MKLTESVDHAVTMRSLAVDFTLAVDLRLNYKLLFQDAQHYTRWTKQCLMVIQVLVEALQVPNVSRIFIYTYYFFEFAFLTSSRIV